METYDTSKVNKKINERINKEIEKMFDAGKTAHELSAKADIKDIDGIGKYILADDEEKYDALQRLSELIRFKNVPANELFKIDGLKMNVDGKEVAMPLVLPLSKFEVLSEQAEYLEKKLKDFNLKFPSELFRFQKRYKKENLPGKDYPPPKPQQFEMSDEDYEKYLETYYKNHGVEKKEDGIAFRMPYPHEKIDYREGNEEKEDFTNEHFSKLHIIHARGRGETKSAPIGERIKVIATSVRKPSLKDGDDKVKASINWDKISSIVFKTVAISAGVIGAMALLKPGPITTTLIVSALGAAALGRYIAKVSRRRKYARRRAEKEEEEEKSAPSKPAEEKAKTKEKEKERTSSERTRTTSDEPEPTKTKIAPSPKESSRTRTYNHEDMLLAEEEIGLDATEFNRIDSELNTIYQKVQKLMSSSDPKDAEELRDLQEQLEEKINERLELTNRLMERQERLLEDIGVPSRSR